MTAPIRAALYLRISTGQAHLATENARQGFWNGALPLIGYRIVAGEQRGHRTKRTWRSIPSRPRPYGRSSAWPGKVMAPRDKWVSSPSPTISTLVAFVPVMAGALGLAAVHKVLTWTTYIGRHRRPVWQEFL
jgi:site-specific DNA recombinase